MSDQDNLPNEYSELRSMFKYHIDVYVALYQLKTENEEDLNSIYKMIKTNLNDSKKCSPQNIIERISKIIPHNNRYIKSYLTLMKLITDGYNLTEVRDIPITWAFLFYKEYGIKLDKYANFEEMNLQNIDIHSENTIYRAIMNNDLETFIFITEKEGFDKNQQLQSSLYPESEEGYSLLELCCYHGAVDCFKLLRTKFNSEITEQCLWFSFLGGNQDIMSECLKYQEPDYECMEYAIISHNIDFVTFLMNEYDIDINISDCAEYNNLESFLVYFDQTNEVNQCFIYSALFDNPSLCEYFLSLGANVNEKNIYGATALDNAVRNNSKKTAEFLITHGATINTPGKYSVLHVAAIKNSKETAEILISHGADIDGIDENYNTPLIYAANKNNSEIVELLISHGANVNKKDEYGFTSLHFTARENNAKMAQLLISHGAKPNKKMTAEKTVLHTAAANNSKETAELLISHGANINEKDNYGRTALHTAAANNSKETTELLISLGAKPNKKMTAEKTVLHTAAANNSKETAELLISHGANINEKDNYGRTALHFAAMYNSKETTELLISLGANINEKDNYGQTAFHLAAIKNNKETAELLISHGANINEKDKKKKTALHLAAMYNSKETTELLISLGANINEKDNSGQTALQLAAIRNNKETAELLISHGA